ncbi:aminotransferase class I/II-fold pyridoxal phosphate-dependent enzyme [Flexivirga meconopsidis]|uniref:aminotransferase class I/II-fold pyridoxal phosphate-dependent enzyme n=1 Tax=Flexivirga meconopsidis TaxID=2977121 RepID=UPI00223F09EF|nr:aminotransferase class I/II-fold pyridoxal phosphate-dependent enzyme [Flexivirga meconopsidis]
MATARESTIDAMRAHLAEPSSRGIADAVTAALRSGELSAGDLLPPVRQVAHRLQVSPTTVSAAWSLLSRAGAIRTDGRRGTRIASLEQRGPARYRQALETRPAFALDLATGVPDPLLLPDLGPAVRKIRTGSGPSSYLEAPVLPELEAQLRATWPGEPERITVVDGAMDALDQVIGQFVRPGDRVVVEDPTFPQILDRLEAAGAVAVPVAVDRHGMRSDALAEALSGRVRLVVLQPRGHNPTGATLTPARVGELCRALADHDCLVIEDDSAGDLSDHGPVSLARRLPARTVHIRSFSKSHGPDLRIAAVGGPASLIDPLVERRLLGQGWTSRLLQQVLLELLRDPAGVRAVADARVEYAQRRRLLADGLAAEGIDLPDGEGLNLWLPVVDEAAALVLLASRGIGAAAGRPFSAAASPEPHLRVTCGLVATDHEHLAVQLAAAARAPGWSGPR